MIKEILFTTINEHKLASASSVLEKFGIDVKSVEVKLDEIQSNDPSQVAIDKAEKAFKETQKLSQ
ncbi:MAG: hypothetical protein KatS3mg085_742 [Candidatus Dojkabacteria bacterium]|nr:MAG: hypothetical protein KatS3mg085_742 [Candidatus Dojkabacteria bacterium]